MTLRGGVSRLSMSARSSRSRLVTSFSGERMSGRPVVASAGVDDDSRGGFSPAYTSTPAFSAPAAARPAITHLPHRAGAVGTRLTGTALVPDSDRATG